MTSAGISRSGRVRKKSAKLMEMETVDDGADPNAEFQKLKMKKIGKPMDEEDDDEDEDSDSDSEPEKFFEKKVSPIRIPKLASTLPVKKRPSMILQQSTSPVTPSLPQKIGMPQKTTVISQKSVIPQKSVPQKTVIQSKTLMTQKNMSQKNIISAKPKMQQMVPRIGIVPSGSTSSSSSSSSSSTTSSDSSDSNSDSESDHDKKPPMMGITKIPPMAMNKPKQTPMPQMAPKMIKKEKLMPTMMSKPKHMMQSSISEGSEAMMNSDDDDDDDETTTSSESLDETEDNLRIVEEPIPKQKKFVKKKETQRKPMNKNARANASANAAANVLANLGNPAALQSRPMSILGPKTTKKFLGNKAGRSKRPEKIKTRPMTAYMLWCQHNRKKIVSTFPNMDFSMISKKMGEVWQSLQDKEKMAWKRKAKKLANKRLTFISTGKSSDLKLLTQKLLTASTIRPVDESSRSSIFGQDSIRLNDTSPIDIAAHLKLLGESLSIIGQRLTEHEGQIAVSGSLSVLLDSTLCALAPLLCLTAQVEPLNGSSQEVLGSTLDNVAYIMPGL